jgi:hypothetical protein
MTPQPQAEENIIMHYKTIVMELINDQPELAVQLRGKKQMLATIETYAVELKNRHEAWKEELSQTRPGSHPSQIASDALERAIEELRDHLPSVSVTDEAEALSLEAAMAYLRRHSPPA